MMAPPRATLVFLALAAAVLLGRAPSTDALFLTPAERCELDKVKVAAKYGFCRLKVAAKSMKTGLPADFSRCRDKFLIKWAKTEHKALGKGLPCPSEGDALLMAERIERDTVTILLAVSGVRWIDNEDGTVADTVTGLTWERKVAGSGCLHCADDFATWSELADWLSAVNGATDDPGTQSGLGGYSNWRVPSLAELATLVREPCPAAPCFDPVFGPAPTMPATPYRYWSSTTSSNPTAAWYLDFGTGSPAIGGKSGSGIHVRAVRGGL